MWHFFRRRMAALQCYRGSSNDHPYFGPYQRGRPSKRTRIGVELATSASLLVRSVWRGAMRAVAIVGGKRKEALNCFQQAQAPGVSPANWVWRLAASLPSSMREDDRHFAAADIHKHGDGDGIGYGRPGKRFVFICYIKVIVVDAAGLETTDPQHHSQAPGMFRMTAE